MKFGAESVVRKIGDRFKMGIHASTQSSNQRQHLNSAGEELNDAGSSNSSEGDLDRTSENQASLKNVAINPVANTTIHGSTSELNGSERYPAPEEDTVPLDLVNINQVWPLTQFYSFPCLKLIQGFFTLILSTGGHLVLNLLEVWAIFLRFSLLLCSYFVQVSKN